MNSRSRGGFSASSRKEARILSFRATGLFSAIESREGRICECSLSGSGSCFVSRVAEGLELGADRIELIEKRGGSDPTLQHIAMALRAGVQSGDAHDRMYGEGLSTALAAHLLREYGAAPIRPKRQNGGLPRAKLVRAIEYIRDQLDADLTVSGIARAVGMGPDHFAKLFKESTGRSPYRFVVEARARKAKELLSTGKFTISEAAHLVGFVDQSHLTRHFKEFSAYLLSGC